MSNAEQRPDEPLGKPSLDLRDEGDRGVEDIGLLHALAPIEAREGRQTLEAVQGKVGARLVERHLLRAGHSEAFERVDLSAAALADAELVQPRGAAPASRGSASALDNSAQARMPSDVQLEVAKICHDDRVRDERALGVLDLDLQPPRGCSGDAFARVTLDQKILELEHRLDVRVEVRQAQVVEVVDGSSRADEPCRRNVDSEREYGVFGQVKELECRAGSEGY
jgi:hypothetical protein